MMAQREWVVNATPRPLYPRERFPLLVLQETGWAPGPVWRGAENLTPSPGFNPRTVQPVVPSLYQRTHISCCILNWEHSEIWNFVLLCQYGRLSFAMLVEYSQTFFKSQNKTWISLGIMFRVFSELMRCPVISTHCKCICILILTTLKMTIWVVETCQWLLCSKITFIHLSDCVSHFFNYFLWVCFILVLQLLFMLSYWQGKKATKSRAKNLYWHLYVKNQPNKAS
jgi:hypothetical protein